MTAQRAATFVVIGEALIDFVEQGDDEARLARPGGSPYNIAIGLARLGRHTCFAGRLSADPLGVVLRRHAERSDVDLSLAVVADEPSTVALVELGPDGGARYVFGIDGTADFRWTDAELAAIGDDITTVHFGSLASWLPPGDAAIARRLTGLRAAGVTISYDPNVRPHLQPDGETARVQVEQALPLAHLVKTSDEDLHWLYPGVDAEDVARRWLTFGPSVVIVTRGAEGSLGVTGRDAVTRPPLPVQVVDTVGAGDAYMSGLLDAAQSAGVLNPAGLAALDGATLSTLLDAAAVVAAITCSRAGANPPRQAELAALLTG